MPLLVLDRKVAASRRTRARPHARDGAGHAARDRGIVVLQLHLRERFGWWPVRRARLHGGHATLLA